MRRRIFGSIVFVLCLMGLVDGRPGAVQASTQASHCAVAVMAVDLSLPLESTGQLQRWYSDTHPFNECPSQPAWVLYDTIVKSVLTDSADLAAALQARSDAANLAVGVERVLDAARSAAQARTGVADPVADTAAAEVRVVLFANALVSGESPEATDQNRRWLRHVLLPELESAGLSLMMVLPAGGDAQILEALRQAKGVQQLPLDSAGEWRQALSDWFVSPTLPDPLAVAKVAEDPPLQQPAATVAPAPAPPVIASDPSEVADSSPATLQREGDSVSMSGWLILLGVLIGVLGVAGVGVRRWLHHRRSSVPGRTAGATLAQSDAIDEATQTLLITRSPSSPAAVSELTSTEKLPPRTANVVKPAATDDTLDTSQSGRTVSRYRPLHEQPGGGTEGEHSENLSAWDMPADRFEKDRR